MTQRGGTLPSESELNQHPGVQGTHHRWRCCDSGESLKPCSSRPVVTADPRTLFASAQAFSLVSLTNLPLGNSAERNSFSTFISCYAFFTSCHQWPCTPPFHWASATSLCSTPQILLGLMQWVMHEGLILWSCWQSSRFNLLLCFLSNEISGLIMYRNC